MELNCLGLKQRLTETIRGYPSESDDYNFKINKGRIVRFMDFYKAYNYIHRAFLVNIIREFGLDPETTNITKTH